MIAALLNFGVVWLIAVMGLMAWRNKSLRARLIKIWGGATAGLVIIGVLTGYIYWDSFWLAKGFEGYTGGFYGLVEPRSYLVTRIQDILEPLVFWGPYTGVMLMASLISREKHRLVDLARFAMHFGPPGHNC